MDAQRRTQNTLYDLLEVSFDATPQEIQKSYLRLKSAYGKDSIAVYSLMDADDSEQILDQIEDAYKILSNSKKRSEYDHRIFGKPETPFETGSEDAAHQKTHPRKVISINRVPPMEDSLSDEELLTPPSTDYDFGSSRETPVDSAVNDPFPRFLPIKRSSTKDTPPPIDLEDKITQETEWKGSFLQEIREKNKLSIEELSEHTKISKTYLRAIEEENFDKLPAAVYLRGFVIQIAKKLNLPYEKVAAAYIARYRESRSDES